MRMMLYPKLNKNAVKICTNLLKDFCFQCPHLPNFFLPYYSLSQLQRCVKYSGVRLWNCIPENIKKLAHKNFVVAYKKVLTDQYK